MKSLSLLAAAALAFPLAACNNEPETIVQGPVDPMAAEMANAAPVTLPPPVTHSGTFRCSDNSLAYVDFFDGSFVNYRADRGDAPTRLNRAEGETGTTGPWTAPGYSVSGTPQRVTVTAPGKDGLTCNA